MSDKTPKSLGRDFFILARGGQAASKGPQDQSAAAQRARKAARDKLAAEQGKTYSKTDGDK